MFLFLVWCVFFLFLPQSSNWPSFGYTFVSHISFTLMFQWSGAVYSTFAGYFLFFFVSILYMLICKANGWTGFGVMGFYRKVVPNRKYPSFAWDWKRYYSLAVLCFTIKGSDSRVPAKSPALGGEGFLERFLMCCIIKELGCVFTLCYK